MFRSFFLLATMLDQAADLATTERFAFAIFAQFFCLAAVTGVDAAASSGAVVETSGEIGACGRTVGEAEALTGACTVGFPAESLA